MANSFFFPFAYLILREAGLSAIVIGTVAAVRPFIGIVSMPAWGYIADRFGAQKAVLLINIVCAVLLRLGLLLLDQNQVLLVVVLLLSDVFGCAVEPSMDATVLELLCDPGLYGKQRLWGAIGWGWVGAPVAGWAVATYGLPAAVLIHASLIAASLIIICPMTVHAPKRTGSILAVAGIIFRDRVTFFFFLALLVIGQVRLSSSLPPAAPAPPGRPSMRATMQRVAPAARPTACRASWTDARGGAQGTGAIFSFLFFLLQDLGDSGLVMGASLLLTCLTEVPILAYADDIVRRTGLMNAMIFALFCLAARLGFYTIMTDPWMVLAVEVPPAPETRTRARVPARARADAHAGGSVGAVAARDHVRAGVGRRGVVLPQDRAGGDGLNDARLPHSVEVRRRDGLRLAHRRRALARLGAQGHVRRARRARRAARDRAAGRGARGVAGRGPRRAVRGV